MNPPSPPADVETPPISDAVPPVSGESLPPLSGGGKPRPKWRLVVFLLIVGFYPMVIGLLGHFLKGPGDGDGAALPSDVKGLLIVCAESLLVFGLLFAVACFFGRPTRAELFWRPMRWWDWLWGALWSVALQIGIRVVVVGALLLFLLARIVAGQRDPEAMKKSAEKVVMEYRPKTDALVDFKALENPVYVLILTTLLSFVMAGLREELWRSGFMAAARGLLPESWRNPSPRNHDEAWWSWQVRLHRPVVAVSFLAAVVFGLGHILQGVVAVVLTGMVGFVLGLVMTYHRSLWTAVIAHGFFDAASFALLAFVVNNRELIDKLFPGGLKQIGM